jgi:hypothetical protein
MNSESASPSPRPSNAGEPEKPTSPWYSYTRDDGRGAITTYVYTYEDYPQAFSFDHDKQNGVLIVTKSDGTEERFRDNPTRHLLVDPDPETGELRPVVKRGRPAYIWLCREERER